MAVALRLLLVPEERYEPLAEALVTSTSAVHRSVARLQLSGLCKASSRTVTRPSFLEFLVSGVRFAFPAVHGPERTGLATAWTHEDVAPLFADGERPRNLVWASDRGTIRGESLVPLFPNLPAVAARDVRLHELLAMVDVLRVGNARERRVVSDVLGQRLLSSAAD
ncbi:MAG: MarR family transcriptional regulator [Gemmatimonadaceae bacterium]|nr:MarR family transcriptional regulator [Gemmatimonadaceae bacterium]